MRSIIGGEETLPKTGQKLDFVKMTCAKDSVNPSIVTKVESSDWLDRYQRLIPIKRDQLLENVVDRECAELSVQRSECEDSEVPFVEQALEELRQRRESLSSISSDDYCAENPNLSELDPLAEESEEDNQHYFYQCANGSVIFISSLNAKCLMSQYGSIKLAPETLSGRILEIEEFTMDAEIRRRFRYLAHLSDGQPFFVVHLDSKDLGLSEETFLKYKDQIVTRSRRKHQKDREESKAHKKFEEHYDRELYGKYTPADISLADMEAFPSFDDFEGSPPEPVSDEISPTWAGRQKIEAPTFSSDDFFPTLGGAPPPTGASGSFWGQMKSSTTPRKPMQAVASDEDDLGRFFVNESKLKQTSAYTPRNNNNIGDEIAAALAAQQSKQADQNLSRGKKGQKKKKGTKIAF